MEKRIINSHRPTLEHVVQHRVMTTHHAWLRFVVALLILSGAPELRAQSTVHFAIIGDYGFAGEPEADVASLVKKWKPDFIITTGDNNYEHGTDSTIDRNIGQYYHEFISPYRGTFGPGDTTNRFFPCLGNHDWKTPGAEPYFKYFTLPGNERYYDFVRGPVHFFAIDSDENEPDGITRLSTQARWLKNKLSESQESWKLVYFHHPPYSSGPHGNSRKLQWPFRKWGATAVIGGHDHTYERLIVDGLPYFVDGLGGRSAYEIGKIVRGSRVRYDRDFGAMDVKADASRIEFRFFTRKDSLVDTYIIMAGKK